MTTPNFSSLQNTRSSVPDIFAPARFGRYKLDPETFDGGDERGYIDYPFVDDPVTSVTTTAAVAA